MEMASKETKREHLLLLSLVYSECSAFLREAVVACPSRDDITTMTGSRRRV